MAAREPRGEPRLLEVDAALASWRQGDCALGEHGFVHRFRLDCPVSETARAIATEGSDLVDSPVSGLVVLTQTCDIVRSCAERPYLEVGPLVEVDDNWLREIERGRRLAYAFLPTLARRRLVADLDRIMTVEKPVVAAWARTPGWTTDSEGRHFAAALARKRVRFAFPNDFTELVRAMRERLVAKHDKSSDEGQALRALREIRVQASPSWDAKAVDLFFWFIRDDVDIASSISESGPERLKSWLRLAPPTARFTNVDGRFATLADLTAADYVASDPLDLDHLTEAQRSA